MINRFVRRLFWLGAISAIMMGYTNTTFPPFARGVGNSVMGWLRSPAAVPEEKVEKAFPSKAVAPAAASQAAVIPKSSEIYEFSGKKWVSIKGKWYAYSPTNTYLVDGVKTLYIPNVDPSETVEKVKVAKPDGGNEYGGGLVGKDTLNVYTPEGMAEVMKNLETAKVNMKGRNELLKKLSGAND